MEARLFEKPHSCSAAFYAGLAPADHVNQPKHFLRIAIAAAVAAHYVRFEGVRSVLDLGCGNGGFLQALGRFLLPGQARLKGYDLLPANVEQARKRRLPVALRDFLADGVPEWADLVAMTEVLEHLESPDKALQMPPVGTLVLATVPRQEGPDHHDPHHLWAWDLRGFVDLFRRNGYRVERAEGFDRVLLVVGRRER